MTTTTASFSIPALNTKTFRIAFIALFVSASSYAYGILTAPKTYSSAITIGFLSVLVAVFSYNLLKILRADARDLSGELPVVVLYALALHLALILGFYLSGHPETALWAADSYARYIPGAANVANYLHGKEALGTIGVPFMKVFFTQAFVGLFFSSIGVSAVSSAIALMFIKLLTVFVVFFLAKTMFNEKTASIAGLIYVFMPTVLFYTTVFYKEAAVQLMVAAILMSVSKIYSDYRKVIYWVILAVSMILLITERFYLFFLFTPIFILLFGIISGSARKKYIFIFLPIIGAGLYLLTHKYAGWMSGKTIEYHNLFPDMVLAIKDFRLSYSQHPDIAAINLTLPYPLAFLKIMFTPFFTFNKFSLFSDYSYILIWGSFLNQIVVALSLYGMYQALSNEWRKNWFLISPYFLFLCLFAYVAPYSGRLRDSFYPVIVVYAAYAVGEIYTVVRSKFRNASGTMSGVV